MQGNPKVIAQLQDALKEELTAISQYFLHAEMCENWGYTKLGGFIKKQSIDEMKHAEKLISRILLLEGTPDVQILPKIQIGKDVEEQLTIGLRDEAMAIARYSQAVAICAKAGDNDSVELLKGNLRDEELHAEYMDGHLNLFKQLGARNRLNQKTAA